MGAPVTEADVVTSAQAAARLLADRLPPKSKVLVIGATALRLAVRERGLVPVSTAAEHPLAVVQGFGPGIDYGRLAEGGLAVRAGALFVATNADSTIPHAHGTAPGNGSLLKVIEYATGKAPVVAGKPEPPLHRESVIRTGARHPLVIGDRLDTDIEAAYNTGTDSLLVLTGVDNPRTVTLAPAAPQAHVHRREPRRAPRAVPGGHRRPSPAPPAAAGPPRPRRRHADRRRATAPPSTACAPWPARRGQRRTDARRGQLDAAQVAGALDTLAAAGLHDLTTQRYYGVMARMSARQMSRQAMLVLPGDGVLPSFLVLSLTPHSQPESPDAADTRRTRR